MANRFLNNIRINDAYTFPASDGNDGQVITTDGAGNLAFENVSPDAASVIYRDNFTGDGSTATFDLQNSITDEDQTQIYIDGVYQEKSTYSISGTTITFTTAPISAHSVEVISISSINTGPTVLYQDNFTGNGSTTAFTLGQEIDNEIKTFIFLNGVYQFKNTYTVDGTTLTFDTAPANGVAIEVVSIASAVQSDSLQAGAVIIPVKNTHTASIAKGTPVYITGNVGASERLQIAPADASNSAKMPAAGLLLTTLAVNAEGYVITGGYLRNLTTDTIDGTSTSPNDTVYVKAGGGLTMTKPTGTNLIQNIAKVARSASGSSGSLLVSSILRTNDVPNITNDYFWLGNSSGVATATSYTSRFDTAFATKDTDDLSEGATNLYYTDARSRSAISVSGNALSYNSSTGVITSNYEESPTFTGIITASSSSSGDYVRLYGSSGTAQWDIYGNGENLRISENSGGGGHVDIDTNLVVDGNVTLNGATALDFQVADFAQIKFRESGAITIDSDNNQSSRNFQFKDGDGTTLMFIGDNGNVGIGTTSPGTIHGQSYGTTKLHIDGGTDRGQLVIEGDSLAAIAFSDNGATANERVFYQSVNGGLFNIKPLNDNGTSAASTGISMLHNGNVGIGTSDPDARFSAVSSSANSTIAKIGGLEYSGNQRGLTIKTFQSAGGDDCGVEFNAAEGLSGYGSFIFKADTAERMRITSSGNVGIGTTSPGGKLDVVHPNSGTDETRKEIQRWLHDGQNAMSLFAYGNTADTIQLAAWGSEQNISIVTETLGSITKDTTKGIYIKSGGNVGIGTTSPSKTLEIQANNNSTTDTTGLIITNASAQSGTIAGIVFKNYDNNQAYIRSPRTGNTSGVLTFGTAPSTSGVGESGIVERMRITSGGDVLLGGHAANGSINPVLNGYGFQANGLATGVCNFSGANEMFVLNQRDGSGTTQLEFRNGNVERGRIEWTTSATTYNTISDYRLKENINNLTDSLLKINQLQPKSFNFISDPNELRIGFIAHEVQEIVPQAVTGAKDEIREDNTPKYQGLDNSMLVPLLVGAIQELKAEIETLKLQING
jgi:hypothetical protein